MTQLELSDIQGIVLFGYGSLPHARWVHVSFENDESEPGTWLSELRHEVHASARGKRRQEERINVAFTHTGLARLGLAESELASFPRELQQGMSDQLRSHVLGDVDENDPKAWELGGPSNGPIHALVMLYAKNVDAIAALRDRVVGRIAALGGVVVHEDSGELRDPLHEPFGFRDGITQPHVTGSPRPRDPHEDEVPAGEFVLGYRNAYDEFPPSPQGTDGFDIGSNGSYLVYRKLQQDTAGFWQCMLDRARPNGDAKAATKLASSLVGRWPSGAPLVNYPDHDPGPGAEKEAFAFHDADPAGTKCPLGAHIRRANPRDMLAPSANESRRAVGRHRLLRRGRPYGPISKGTPAQRATPDGADRGLVFIALNASFRRQFEFVQQTWLNNPKFAGLYDERDPITASVMDERGQHFSIPSVPVRRRLACLPQFVTLRGGGYFFVPSLRALAWLASRATKRDAARPP
ncbi:MAG: peroxidase [Labilithrix sp.]|nr:peroxidase [Labilithrix sp.]